MKKIGKYLSFLPFAVSAGSIIIYLFYTLKIRFSRRVIVTEELTSTLKTYLILALISLFIGLLIILLKKVYNLFRVDSIGKKEESNVFNKETISLVKEDINSNINKEAQTYIEEKKEYSFKLDGVSCPECGKIISKDALICPYCGIIFDEKVLGVLDKLITKRHYKKKEKKGIIIANILLIILFIFLIFLVSNMLINKSKENNKNVNHIVMIEENIR